MFSQECLVLTFCQLRTTLKVRDHSVQCKLEDKVHYSCRLLFGSDYEISPPPPRHCHTDI